MGQHVEPERLLVQIRPRGYVQGAQAPCTFFLYADLNLGSCRESKILDHAQKSSISDMSEIHKIACNCANFRATCEAMLRK